LTSSRPYKAAWSFEAAMAEIARGAGTQFDPRLVAAFMTIQPRIRELMATYADPPAAEAPQPVPQAV
jgi:putative two-component system response regulator